MAPSGLKIGLLNAGTDIAQGDGISDAVLGLINGHPSRSPEAAVSIVAGVVAVIIGILFRRRLIRNLPPKRVLLQTPKRL